MSNLIEDGDAPLWRPKFDLCHRHACTLLEAPLAQLERHTCAVGDAVSRYFQESPDEKFLEECGDLLCLAGGLRKVEIFTGRYEDDVLYCGSAYEWEKRRSVVVSAYATDVVRLLYVYNAFESIVNNLPLSKRILKGGAPAASSLYLQKYRGVLEFPIAHYECTIKSMACNISKAADWHDLHEVIVDGEKDVAQTFAAMKFVGLIRNVFVHEAFSLPPEPESPRMRERSILRTATRLTLLTIQMLVLAGANRKTDESEYHDPVGLLLSAQFASQYE